MFQRILLLIITCKCVPVGAIGASTSVILGGIGSGGRVTTSPVLDSSFSDEGMMPGT